MGMMVNFGHPLRASHASPSGGFMSGGGRGLGALLAVLGACRRLR